MPRLHSFLTVCIGSNLCKARAAYVNVGFGNRGHGYKEVDGSLLAATA
jgi:hypothetical protein